MDFDIKKYELLDEQVFTFKNIEGDDVEIGADGENPARVVLYSPGSPKGAKALRKAERLGSLRLFRKMRNEFEQGEDENAKGEHVEKLVAFTKEWLNFPVDSTEFFANDRLVHMRKQVEEWIASFKGFKKGSSPNSVSTSGTLPG